VFQFRSIYRQIEMKTWRVGKFKTQRGGKNQAIVSNLLGILLFGFLGVGMAGHSPEISFSVSAISPRLYMVENDTTVFWNTTLDYRQNFTESLEVVATIAGSPSTLRHDQAVQIYDASLIFHKNALKIQVGRLSNWNAFSIMRIDGGEIGYRSKVFGTLSIGGGTETKLLSDEEAKAAYYLSWGKKLGNMIVNARYWSRDEVAFAGGYFFTNLAGFNVRGLSGFNLTESAPSYTRLVLSRKFGSHGITLGYRQFRKSYFMQFPWSDDKNIELPPMISLGYTLKLGKATVGLQNFSRLSDEGSNFIRGSVSWSGINASFHLRSAGKSKITGGTLGWQTGLKKKIKFGISASSNSYEFDGISIPKNSSGLYSWIAWQPNRMFAVRIFTRVSKNSYYESDGRGGVSIRVAL